MVEWTVVVDDCATPQRPNIRNVRLRPTQHGARNFNFNFDRLAIGLSQPLSPRQLDWLRIAGALYAADIACRRGIDRDWARQIELHVPVSDPAMWRPYKPLLEEAFGRLTYDRLDLHFATQAVQVEPPRLRRSPFGPVDSVALLSGGVDSFVGGADLLAEVPATFFVSHAGATVTRTAQNALEPVLRARSATAQFGMFTAQRAAGFGEREGSERSRTILFLSCAGVVAAATGADTIHLSENGVMAVHLPLTAARIGSLSTRTASPSFADSFGDLMASALESPLKVVNRLIHRTKPDVVALARQIGCDSSIPSTISCWSIGHTRQHCGYCAPCMIRRIACELHNVADTTYEHDVFGNSGVIASRPFARDNLVQFIEASVSIASATDEELELRFPELLNGGREITPIQARSLHRRWAEQALSYLSAQPVSSQFL
jgi:7-cyano-7-deazaguanine synthase in queuosine biosynthesis